MRSWPEPSSTSADKHARKPLGSHSRYRHFLDYEEAVDYAARLEEFRVALDREK